MHQLTEEILASREWRIRELEALKKIGIIALNEYPLKVKQQYYRMCIPYIYAHWEGFVVESFKLLITYLNNEHLDKKMVINELYTFSLQNVLKPLAGKQSFESKYENRNSFGQGIVVFHFRITYLSFFINSSVTFTYNE